MLVQQSLLPIATEATLRSQECFDLFCREGLSDRVITLFRDCILDYYAANERSFAWRTIITPYRVVVSEIMLQQTQTHRVAPKFDAFVERFPNFSILAAASFDEVLRYWKGLGYNRRAQQLHAIAKIVTDAHGGKLPNDPAILVTFPGLGKATAASICTFAFNQPHTFIETNIRTIFIYFFFKRETQVPDAALMPLIESTILHDKPRQWYYALMDYGVMLKKEIGNISRNSKHHTKQSKFIGSNRQVRGAILEALLEHKQLPLDALLNVLTFEAPRIEAALSQLIAEKFVIKAKSGYTLKS